MTQVSQMTNQRLNAELVVAERQLHSHREGVHGSCYQRCEDPHPCAVRQAATVTIREVSQALAERAERVEEIRLDRR